MGELKKLKRTGWVVRNVPNSESVAEHSFRTAIIALLLSEKIGLNKDKCVKMALIHDLAESIVGDLITTDSTPHAKITSEEKLKLENKAMKEILQNINGSEISELWVEYNERKTPESKFVHETDKIEMLLQAYEYEKEHKEKEINLNDFWIYAKDKIKNDEMKEIFKILLKKRDSNNN